MVGESGSGKTTLARCLAGLHDPSPGASATAVARLPGLARHRNPELRRRIQIIFQDPDSSLNPSMNVGSIVRRPMQQFFELDRAQENRRVSDLLERVTSRPRLPLACHASSAAARSSASRSPERWPPSRSS